MVNTLLQFRSYGFFAMELYAPGSSVYGGKLVPSLDLPPTAAVFIRI